MSIRQDFEKVASDIRDAVGDGEGYLLYLLREVERHLGIAGIEDGKPNEPAAAPEPEPEPSPEDDFRQEAENTAAAKPPESTTPRRRTPARLGRSAKS